MFFKYLETVPRTKKTKNGVGPPSPEIKTIWEKTTPVLNTYGDFSGDLETLVGMEITVSVLPGLQTVVHSESH